MAVKATLELTECCFHDLPELVDFNPYRLTFKIGELSIFSSSYVDLESY